MYRCVNVAEMDAVARGNKLAQARSRTLEYAVHGKWRRCEEDTNGTHGCWFIGVPELVQAFGAEAVEAKLAAWATAQVAARAEAITSAAAAEPPAERD